MSSRHVAPSVRFVATLAVVSCLLLAGCASGPPPTPTELGWTALEAGDWRGAKQHFAVALRADTGDARAWHGQAAAQLAGRDAEAALRSLGTLAKIDPERFSGAARSTYADALERAVSQRLARDQAEAALAAARALARLEPDRRGLTTRLGRAVMAEADRRRLRGQPKAALALYREACELTPGNLDAWVGAVEILLERKQGREAMRLLEAARRHHPTSGLIRTMARQAMKYRKK